MLYLLAATSSEARQVFQVDLGQPVELLLRREGSLRGFVVAEDAKKLRLLTPKGKLREISRRQIRKSSRLSTSPKGHDTWDYPRHSGEHLSGSIITAAAGRDRFYSRKLSPQWNAYRMRVNDHISVQAVQMNTPGISQWVIQPHIQTKTDQAFDFGTGLFISWEGPESRQPAACMPYSAVYWQNDRVQGSLGLGWQPEDRGWGREPLFLAGGSLRCSRNCVLVLDQRIDAHYRLRFVQAGIQYESESWKFSLALPCYLPEADNTAPLLPTLGLQYLFPG